MLSTIEEMGVAATAFKVSGYSNKNVTTIIAVGFSGQLKNLWNNYLTYDERLVILNHTTNEYDERGKHIQDAPETLVHTITLHFVGNPQKGQAAAKIVIINLGCSTLSNYRWYKDVFFTIVLKREDGM